MKKNNIDFNIPRRQSYVAILIIIWKTYKVIIRQLFPLIIIFFVGGSGSRYGTYLIYFITGIALISMLYAIIAFFRYFYYIENDKLIVEKGVFGRSKTSIPFERIQTINFEQNLAHQVFSVLRLKVDTAGSAKKEFEFDAIQQEEAHQLRDVILSKRKKLIPSQETQEEITTDYASYQTILRLNITDLLKIGITENHIRSGGLILLAMWWIWDSLDEAGLNPEQYTEDINPMTYGLIMIVAFIIFFMLVSFLISLVRTVIAYYGLEFLRSRDGFKLMAGLFTKKDTSALDHKIQMVGWSDNLLRKLVGYYELQLKQASSVAVNQKTSIKIPGCRIDQIERVATALYGHSAFANITMHPVHISFKYRRMFFLSLISIPLVVLGYMVDQSFLLYGGILLTIYFIISSHYRYKKCQYGHNDQMLLIRGGLFGDKAETLPIFKMQNIILSQSPYQRRKQLANVKVYTAAGSVTIPYVPYPQAIALSDYLLYKTQSSRKQWM